MALQISTALFALFLPGCELLYFPARTGGFARPHDQRGSYFSWRVCGIPSGRRKMLSPRLIKNVRAENEGHRRSARFADGAKLALTLPNVEMVCHLG